MPLAGTDFGAATRDVRLSRSLVGLPVLLLGILSLATLTFFPSGPCASRPWQWQHPCGLRESIATPIVGNSLEEDDKEGHTGFCAEEQPTEALARSAGRGLTASIERIQRRHAYFRCFTSPPTATMAKDPLEESSRALHGAAVLNEGKYPVATDRWSPCGGWMLPGEREMRKSVRRRMENESLW